MPSYSVATTKDNLSSLIDKAMAGEEVIITRHGKPVIEMKLIAGVNEAKPDRVQIYDRLRQNLAAMPMMTTSYLELKRLDEAEGGY